MSSSAFDCAPMAHAYAPAYSHAQDGYLYEDVGYPENQFYDGALLVCPPLPTPYFDIPFASMHLPDYHSPSSDLSTLNSPLYPSSVPSTASSVSAPDFTPFHPASSSLLPIHSTPPSPTSPTDSSPPPHLHASSDPSSSASKPPTKRGHRRIWNHALEKFLFTPEELATLGAPHRRTIYLASLESHIDRLHLQLVELGLYPVPFEALHPYKGLNCKTAKGMVSGLQYDVCHLRMQILEMGGAVSVDGSSSRGAGGREGMGGGAELLKMSRKFSLDSNMPGHG